MATVTTPTELQELLFRLGDGKVKGAHVLYLEKVVVDGVVKAENLLAAQPVKVVKDDPTLKALIGEVVLAQQATIEDLTAQVAEHERTIAELKTAPPPRAEELESQAAIIQHLMEELDALKNPPVA